MRDLLGEFGDRVGLDGAVETGILWAKWREIVGDSIADHAEPTSLKQGVLRICADSPAWATEIGYLGDKILRSCNAAAGRPVVRAVTVWTGPRKAKKEEPPRAQARQAEPLARAANEAADDPVAALDRARRAWAARSRSKG